MRYCRPLMVTLTWLMALLPESRTERMVSSDVEPLGDLAVWARVQRARAHQRAVELVGKPRAVGASAYHECARHSSSLGAVREVAPPLDRASTRPARGKPAGGELESRSDTRRVGGDETVGAACRSWRSGGPLGMATPQKRRNGSI